MEQRGRETIRAKDAGRVQGNGVFQTQQVRCTYARIAIVTTCIKPMQTHAKQNGSMEERAATKPNHYQRSY